MCGRKLKRLNSYNFESTLLGPSPAVFDNVRITDVRMNDDYSLYIGVILGEKLIDYYYNLICDNQIN